MNLFVTLLIYQESLHYLRSTKYKTRKCFRLTYFWASLYFCSYFRGSTRRSMKKKKTISPWKWLFFEIRSVLSMRIALQNPSESFRMQMSYVFRYFKTPTHTSCTPNLLIYDSSMNNVPFASIYRLYTSIMLRALFYNYHNGFGFIIIDVMLWLTFVKTPL